MPCSRQLGTDDLYISRSQVPFTFLLSLMQISLIPRDILQPSGLPTASTSSILRFLIDLGAATLISDPGSAPNIQVCRFF